MKLIFRFVDFKRKYLTARQFRMLLVRHVLSRFSFMRRNFACYGSVVDAREASRRILFSDEVNEVIPLSRAERDHYAKYEGYGSIPMTDEGIRFRYENRFLELTNCQILPKSGGILHVPTERLVTSNSSMHFRSLVKPFRYKGVVHVPGLCVSLMSTPSGHAHYFHFLFETLKPFIAACRKAPEFGNATILTRENLARHQQVTLRALHEKYPGLAIRAMPDDVRIECERLLYPEPSAGLGVSEFGDRATLLAIGSMLRKAAGANGIGRHRRLLISRKRQKWRKLINEDSLFEALEPMGFERIAPETLPFEEQVRTFASAEIVVGASGAALTNLLFCSPGATVIETCPTEVHRHFWILLARQMGLNYHFIPGSEGGIYKAFSVDADAFSRTVRGIPNVRAQRDSG